MYNNSGLAQPNAIAELPALEDFVSRFQKAAEELNSLGSRLYTITNRLDQDIKDQPQPAIPMPPRKFNDGLLSKLEVVITAFQDQINYQDRSIRKLESLL